MKNVIEKQNGAVHIFRTETVTTKEIIQLKDEERNIIDKMVNLINLMERQTVKNQRTQVPRKQTPYNNCQLKGNT